jgi:hypothetical protein
MTTLYEEHHYDDPEIWEKLNMPCTCDELIHMHSRFVLLLIDDNRSYALGISGKTTTVCVTKYMVMSNEIPKSCPKLTLESSPTM